MTSIRNILLFRGAESFSEARTPTGSPDPEAAVRAPVTRSIIGHAAVNMARAHIRLSDQVGTLTAEIARLTEECRQARIAAASLGEALTQIKGDPALTDDERTQINDALESEIDRQLVLVDADLGVDELR